MDIRIGVNADSSTIDGRLAVLDGLLEEFRSAGFTHAEIPVHGVDCIANGSLVTRRVNDVVRILGKHPLSYTVHGPDSLNLADPERPDLQASALRASVDFAAEIGAGILVYHGSLVPGGDDAEGGRRPPARKKDFDPSSVLRTWKEEIGRLAAAASYAEGKGVVIAAENIFRQQPEGATYRIDPRELACVVEAVASPSLGICFDFGHAFMSSLEEGFSLSEALDAARNRLVHVHIHDNFGVPRSIEGKRTIDAMLLGEGDLHLPPGWGGIPYPELFPRFAPGYRGVYMLELQPRFADLYGEAAEWVRRSVEDATGN